MHDRTDEPEGTDRHDEPTLRLDDALKLAGLAETGGQAKHRIQAGDVTVNDVVETRRKRRLRQGDVVGIDGETFDIDLETDAPADDAIDGA
jgi:ribosome-associated protein